MRVLQFVYDDRQWTLYYIDDCGRIVKCINGVVGTLEIIGIMRLRKCVDQ